MESTDPATEIWLAGGLDWSHVERSLDPRTGGSVDLELAMLRLDMFAGWLEVQSLGIMSSKAALRSQKVSCKITGKIWAETLESLCGEPQMQVAGLGLLIP